MPTVTEELEPPAWGTDARLCELAVDDDHCDEARQTCAPVPSAPFSSQLCVYRVVLEEEPIPSCPASYARGPELLYTSFGDSRGCGACECSPPRGERCGGTVTVSNHQDCRLGLEYTIGSGCQRFALPFPPSHVDVTYEMTRGTCSVATEPSALGEVTGSGSALVVCCR